MYEGRVLSLLHLNQMPMSNRYIENKRCPGVLQTMLSCVSSAEDSVLIHPEIESTYSRVSILYGNTPV